MLEQPAHRSDSCGSISRSSDSASAGQLAQQVGGVVGVHRLQHVGGALGLELPEQFDLVVVGQLLHDVGEAFVVERSATS